MPDPSDAPVVALRRRSTRSTPGPSPTPTVTASAISTGVRHHLDHLAWLGVDAVWLSPFYRSPMADFGYDVADYCDVDPLFGDLAGFDRAARRRPRRSGSASSSTWCPTTPPTSTRGSRPSRSQPRRPQAGLVRVARRRRARPAAQQLASAPSSRAGRPGPGTTPREQWYLHQFLPEQPDLNWDNPEVVEAMHDVMRFWLDRGVDGFRIDVVHCIGRDPALPRRRAAVVRASPTAPQRAPHAPTPTSGRCAGSPTPTTGDRVLIGETALPGHQVGRAVLRRGRRAAPGLQLRRHPRGLGRGRPGARRHRAHRRGARSARRLAHLGALEPRHASAPHPLRRERGPGPGRRRGPAHAAGHAVPLRRRGARSRGRDRAARPSGRSRRSRRLPRPDPLGRRRHRTAGVRTPWLPFPPEAIARSVAVQRDDPGSILHLYRRLLTARRSSPALHVGDAGGARVARPASSRGDARSDGDERTVLRQHVIRDRGACPGPAPWRWPATVRARAHPSAARSPDTAVILRP